MVTPWDQFIENIERKKRQLDELLESYKQFRDKLESLPPEIGTEAKEALFSESRKGVEMAKETETATIEKKDCVGKTALECAKIILTDHGNQSLHFSTIAKEALQRGYQGRATGTKEEIESVTANSFWAALSRSKELEPVGKGVYRLRLEEKVTDSVAGDIEPHGGQSHGPPRLVQLREFLKKRGPLPRKDIVAASGIPEGTLGMYLTKEHFAQDAWGNWSVAVAPGED